MLQTHLYHRCRIAVLLCALMWEPGLNLVMPPSVTSTSMAVAASYRHSKWKTRKARYRRTSRAFKTSQRRQQPKAKIIASARKAPTLAVKPPSLVVNTPPLAHPIASEPATQPLLLAQAVASTTGGPAAIGGPGEAVAPLTPPGGADEAAATAEPEDIEKQLNNALNDNRIKVRAIPDGKNPIFVRLAGALRSAEEVTAADKIVKATVPQHVQVISGLYADKEAPLYAPNSPPATPVVKKVDRWPLSFVSGRVTALANSTAPASGNSLDAIITALNNIYDPGTAEDKRYAVQRTGASLTLYGTPDKLLEMKRLLALIDVPYPQVQMQMWVVQASGNREQVRARMREAAGAIQATRSGVLRITQELLFHTLQGAATKNWLTSDIGDGINVFDQLKEEPHEIVIDPKKPKPTSLNQLLIFMALSKERSRIFSDFARRIQEDRTLQPLLERAHRYGETRMFRRLSYLCESHPAALYAGGGGAQRLEPTTELTINYQSDRQGVLDFLQHIENFKNHTDHTIQEAQEAPWELTESSIYADNQMAALMTAFSQDMNDLLFKPLLFSLQNMTRNNNGAMQPGVGGVTLVGNTELVVTSGQEVLFDSEMHSSVQNNVPAPLDASFLKGALVGDSSLAKALPNLSGSQVALVAAALSQPAPSYTTVAPGVGIHVLPKVLADSASARLQIDFRFGVGTTAGEASSDSWQLPPADRVTSHRNYNNINVAAFDLVGLSSFNIQSSHPQPPYYVPILGRLPLIGSAFQIPRKAKLTEHESMVLINTVIVPRAVDLIRFHGQGP